MAGVFPWEGHHEQTAHRPCKHGAPSVLPSAMGERHTECACYERKKQLEGMKAFECRMNDEVQEIED